LVFLNHKYIYINYWFIYIICLNEKRKIIICSWIVIITNKRNQVIYIYTNITTSLEYKKQRNWKGNFNNNNALSSSRWRKWYKYWKLYKKWSNKIDKINNNDFVEEGWAKGIFYVKRENKEYPKIR